MNSKEQFEKGNYRAGIRKFCIEITYEKSPSACCNMYFLFAVSVPLLSSMKAVTWVWICTGAAGHLMLLFFLHYFNFVFLLPAQPPLGSQLPMTGLRGNTQLLEF